MITINIQTGDAPKLYARLDDIYGNVLNVAASDIELFTYSVYKIVYGERVGVDGYTNVNIPISCYHATPAAYPSNIVGLSTADVAKKYNVEVFPYKLNAMTGNWESPFSSSGQYMVEVNLRYPMEDDALTGTGYINKTFLVRVNVGV